MYPLAKTNSVACEVTCQFDYNVSHSFDENIEMLQYGSQSTYSMGYFHENNPIETPEVKDLLTVDNSNKQILKYMRDVLKYDAEERRDVFDQYGDDLKDFILDKLELGFNDIYKDDFKSYSEDGLSISLNTDGYEFVYTKGYTQGDYALCVVPKHVTIPKSYINNLFWDAPIIMTVIINGVELTEGEILEDKYDYDKAKAINSILANKRIKDLNLIGLRDVLTQELPEEPKQSY